MKSKTINVSLILLFVLIGYTVKAQDKSILFICEHGSAKSIIAATYFQKTAAENNLKWNALSRGTHPDSILQLATQRGLEGDGFNTESMKPAVLTENDILKAEIVVTLGCKLPEEFNRFQNKILEWNDVPPISKDYSAARDVIRKNINLLLKSLKSD
ncbi:hypothetical protein K1X84_12070 [bacterium]|nr:hypothetical protein [bacterium]